MAEHRASSSSDGGLWRRLLEKAKKGTTTEPYFAAHIVVENLPTSMFPKLGLPAEFLEHHREKLTENILLEGPDGHTWSVMLGMSWDSKPCLLHGWRELATECNLAVHDQILFFLLEDSHFQFQVFDSHDNVRGTSADIARTTLPQVAHPSQNILSSPSGNNNSGVAKNVHKEKHTTQGSPSGEKLGNQEPGVEEDDDRVPNFFGSSAEVFEGFQSAPLSDAEEDQARSIERARNLNRKTTGRGGDELHKPIFDPPAWIRGSTVSVHDLVEQATAYAQATAEAPVRESKEPKCTQEVLPVKRARQAPTDRSQPVSLSTSKTWQARGMNTSSDDPDSRVTMSAPPTWNRLNPRKYDLTLEDKIDQATFHADVNEGANAKECEAADVAARIAQAALLADMARKKAKENIEGEARARTPASVAASDSVTPLPVETQKRTFKRPQPRKPSRQQMYSKQIYSKRRPVTPQERQAALEDAHECADACSNRAYVMQLTASQVYNFGNILAWPADFAQAMELLQDGFEEVMLYDRSGRSWKTVWYAQDPKRTGLDGPGWNIFVRDNFLEEGDVCVFELPGRKASDIEVTNIAVTVFRVVPLDPMPKNWNVHYSVDARVVPAVIQPEAALNRWAALGQSSSFETGGSGMEGKRRKMNIDLNSEMNRSCEEDKSNENGKRCMEETATEG